MKFYIATGYENQLVHNKLRDLLVLRGWEITFDWTTAPVRANSTLTRKELSEVAGREVAGVLNSDVVFVALPGGKGTHTELGLAIGNEIPVILLRDDFAPECPFYYARGVYTWETYRGEVLDFEALESYARTQLLPIAPPRPRAPRPRAPTRSWNRLADASKSIFDARIGEPKPTMFVLQTHNREFVGYAAPGHRGEKGFVRLESARRVVFGHPATDVATGCLRGLVLSRPTRSLTVSFTAETELHEVSEEVESAILDVANNQTAAGE